MEQTAKRVAENLEARLKGEQSSYSLLRAVQEPAAPAGHLLRAAHAGPSTKPEELLRTSDEDASA